MLFLVGLAAPLAAQTDYQIGAQDVLTITVFGETDLSGKYTVEQDGTFTFPLIGRVTAGGVTLRDLEQELKKRLADGFLKKSAGDASAIETYRSQRILDLGEVRAPAEYQLTGDMTLLAALARAGGTDAGGGPRSDDRAIAAASGRANAGGAAAEAEIIRVDLAELQAGNLALNIPLIDGDTITIPKAQSVFVSGASENARGVRASSAARRCCRCCRWPAG